MMQKQPAKRLPCVLSKRLIEGTEHFILGDTWRFYERPGLSGFKNILTYVED